MTSVSEIDSDPISSASHFLAAYRDVEGDDFTVLWPEGLSTFEVQ